MPSDSLVEDVQYVRKQTGKSRATDACVDADHFVQIEHYRNVPQN